MNGDTSPGSAALSFCIAVFPGKLISIGLQGGLNIKQDAQRRYINIIHLARYVPPGCM
jgi:hypothetical protein